MLDLVQKRIGDKEKILRYLIIKGSIQNTYRIARELEMERGKVLDLLRELVKEDKVQLRSGSVKAVTSGLNEEEKVKIKSEVEELKEKVEKLEKWVGSTFKQIREAICIEHHQNAPRETQSIKDKLNQEDIKIQEEYN